MEFNYVLDANSNEPIMLIDSHIGYDNELGMGVNASQFCRELMLLDSMDKSRVQIWMNSIGGSVLDAQQIYNTILKTKTKVDTYCVGLVASSAGFIFQAGRKRYMMDGTNLMMHNPYNPENPEDNGAIINLLTDSIVTMICSRSGVNEQKIRGMMNVTTWLNAQDCKNMGLCDEVEYLDSFNKARKISIESPMDAVKEYSNILNKVIEDKKPIKMNKVYNKLNLNPAVANVEDLAVSEIEKIEVSNKLTSEKLEATEKELKDAKELVNTLNERLEAIKKVEVEKLEAEKASKVEFLVSNAVKDGKIANDETVVSAYKAMANADLENTTKVIDTLPVNKKSADFNGAKAKEVSNSDNSKAPSIDITNPASYLAKKQVELLAKLKSKI